MKQRLYYILPALLLFVGAAAYGQLSGVAPIPGRTDFEGAINQFFQSDAYNPEDKAQLQQLLPEFMSQIKQLEAGATPSAAEEMINQQLEQAAKVLEPRISLFANPATPAEGQPVTISVESFRIPNIDAANYLWFINNKPIEDNRSGLGKNTLVITAPKAGTIFPIGLILTTLDKQNFRADVTLRTILLELEWSAHTYTPPSYSARPLYSAESKVTVTATARINGEDAKNLLYEWFLDDEKRFTSSGFGNQEFSFVKNTERVGAEHSIRVKISNRDKTIEAQKAIAIKAVQPEIIIYRSDGQNGFTLPQVLSEYTVRQGQEINFVAVPYFFSISKPEELVYNWTFNGKSIAGNPKNPHLLTLKVPEGAAEGTYDLSVSGRTPDKILQNASFRVTINVR